MTQNSATFQEWVNSRLLERLIDNYNIFYEGLPTPVFYEGFYPLGDKKVGGKTVDLLWSLFHHAYGLKRDKDANRYWFNQNELIYENELSFLFDLVGSALPRSKSVGVVAIPSSKSGVTNRVTEVVRNYLNSLPAMLDPFDPKGFAAGIDPIFNIESRFGAKVLPVDLTRIVVRSKDIASAHNSGGSRSTNVRKSGLAIRNSAVSLDLLWRTCPIIVVIDDILTTGNSFRAMDEFLRDNGYHGILINFAFSHTCPDDGVLNYLHQLGPHKLERLLTEEELDSDYIVKPFNIIKEDYELEAIILDFDQTIIEDSVRDPSFEDGRGFSSPVPYKLYRGVKKILAQSVPYALVSNRGSYLLNRFYYSNKVIRDLFLNGWAAPPVKYHLPDSFFPYCSIDNSDISYTTPTYKPSARRVIDALQWLNKRFPGTIIKSRVIGLGNTPEDMAAYHAAGIVSCLALWGVPNYLKSYAIKHWNSSYTFFTVNEFVSWFNNHSFETLGASPFEF